MFTRYELRSDAVGERIVGGHSGRIDAVDDGAEEKQSKHYDDHPPHSVGQPLPTESALSDKEDMTAGGFKSPMALEDGDESRDRQWRRQTSSIDRRSAVHPGESDGFRLASSEGVVDSARA